MYSSTLVLPDEVPDGDDIGAAYFCLSAEFSLYYGLVEGVKDVYESLLFIGYYYCCWYEEYWY